MLAVVKLFFSSWKRFSLVYFTLVFLYILCNNIEGFFTLRYLVKPLVNLSIIGYFHFNSKRLNTLEKKFSYVALLALLLGDLFLIHDTLTLYFMLGMVMFALARICYSIVFSSKAYYNIDRVIPFLAVTLLFILLVIYLIIDKLEGFTIPVFGYIFLSLLMTKIAYLRKDRVNGKSYNFVMLGCIFFIISETIMVLHKFYTPLPFVSFSIMLFYSLGQYFIISGLTFQREIQGKGLFV